MAGLTRKALAAMGIEETQIDQIIDIHTATVTEIKDERDSFKAKASELDSVKGQLKELQEEVNKGDRSPYKKKYEELQAEFDKLQGEFETFKSDTEAKATKAKQKDAYKKMLSEAGVSEKFLDFVIKNAEADGKFAKMEFEEDGTVKEAEGYTKEIASDYADFIVSKDTQGANTPNPPANDGGQPSGQSRAALMAARYHANLYGEAKEA